MTNRRTITAALVVPVMVIVALPLLAGCGEILIPDQTEFALLDDVPTDQAAVRVYAAPLPWIGAIAVHTWFAVKQAESTQWTRWDVWLRPAEPFGYVRKDLFDIEEDIGGGDSFILAELLGDDAQAIVEFINNESQNYPCADDYVFYPGPNSNTYTQWILDSTMWAVDLPYMAIGQNVAPSCP